MVLVGFGAGVAVGLMLPAASRAPDVSQARTQTAPVAPQTAVVASPAPASLPDSAITDALDPVRERLRSISELNALLSQRIRLRMFAPFGKVDDGFSKVFGLTGDELARLTAGLETTKARIAALDAKHAVIEPVGDGGYRIAIAPYPCEGGAVYDGLQGVIQEVLGPERFAAWREMSDEIDTDWTFRKFGLSETTITLHDAKEGENMIFSTGTHSREDGVVVTTVKTTSQGLADQYPEVYWKMVADGLLKQAAAR